MVSAFPLPDDPDLEQLRKQAKDLRDLARAGVDGALDLVGAHHPDGPHPVSLAGAQLVVARHYGFSSWARLKTYVQAIERLRRDPDEIEPAGEPADEFLSLACLRYGEDRSDRRRRAAELLRAHPGVARSNIYVASAAADEGAVRRLLERDPGLAAREGGPFEWEPILYLAYTRHDPAVSEAATLGTARVLLDNGADPNAGYLWHGLVPPFTALTGAFGSGSEDQPEHPHAFALARLLLEAGADPNDGQALYNRQFQTDDRHLEFLLEHGLGRGDGGPWRRRVGYRFDSPAELVRGQLWWAIVHDMRERVRLLVDAGTDIRTPYSAPGGRPAGLRTSDGRTPAQVAAMAGCPELAEWLTQRGSPGPTDEGVDGLIAAILAADRDAVLRLADHTEAARSERPALIVWAAARGNTDAVVLAAELGFDVNALGRTDIPMEQQWETALHEAAASGNTELARALLDLGADPSRRDTRFHSTPLEWAHHFAQPATIELLESLTPGPS